MTHAERHRQPAWAERERADDIKWIGENMHLFWPAAQQCYAEQGRGAIVVNTMVRQEGAGNPFFYLIESGVEAIGGADALRIVKAYDPTWQIVTTLLKSEKRISTYRIGLPAARKERTPITK